MSAPLLSVENAAVHFAVRGGKVRAVNDVSFTLAKGETLAVVGESGCGKTTLARAILGLEPLAEGSIELDGLKVTEPTTGLAARVGMVWQDPNASLDPRWKVGKSATEPLRLLRRAGSDRGVFEEVGLDPQLVDRYPHQLSGGQRQRVAIGRALALKPPIVICDEPTAALDLSVRAQILNLLMDIQRELGCSFLYISHDLTTVRYLADRVAVMYLGKIVELGESEEVFGNPRHPYTKALLESAPTLEKLMFLPEPLEGEIPDPRQTIIGCPFASRCPRRQDVCLSTFPARTDDGKHSYWCHFPLQKSQDIAHTSLNN